MHVEFTPLEDWKYHHYFLRHEWYHVLEEITHCYKLKDRFGDIRYYNKREFKIVKW